MNTSEITNQINSNLEKKSIIKNNYLMIKAKADAEKSKLRILTKMRINKIREKILIGKKIGVALKNNEKNRLIESERQKFRNKASVINNNVKKHMFLYRKKRDEITLVINQLKSFESLLVDNNITSFVDDYFEIFMNFKNNVYSKHDFYNLIGLLGSLTIIHGYDPISDNLKDETYKLTGIQSLYENVE